MTGTPDVTGAPGGVNWYSTYDEPLKAHIINKGWDKVDQPTAIKNAIQSHHELEKMRGLPDDQIAVIPKTPDDPRWGVLRDRLGVPKDAAGYDFASVKQADGSAPPETFVNTVREIAAANHLTAAQATAMATALLAVGAKDAADAAATNQTKIAAEQTVLRTNWGGEFEMRSVIAKRGAEALGLSKETISAIEQNVGYAKIMEDFYNVGLKTGEAKLLGGGGGGGPASMTRDEAIARKTALYADQGFVQRFVNAEAQAVAEMRNLDVIIVGPPPAAR